MKMSEPVNFLTGVALSAALLASGIKCEDELPPKDKVSETTGEFGEKIERTFKGYNAGHVEDCYEGCPPQDDPAKLCPNNPAKECENDANIDPNPFLQEPLNYE